MKIEIKKDKKASNNFFLKGEFTAGQLLAIKNGLAASGTPVANDVYIQLERALQSAEVL